MDRLLREANPPTGQLASPKPQYKKPGEDAYEPVEGQYGAPFAILKNASGQVISPATDAKLEQVKSELELVKSELQTIKANQLSGDQKVQLSGTKSVAHEVLLDAVSVAPLASTGQINLNITNEKKVVLLVWNDLDTLRIWSSTPWRSVADFEPGWGCLYPHASHFSATPSYNPHVFVWVGMQYKSFGLTDIKEAFDIALPPVSPSFIRVSNDDPDETLTITIHILRYWR
jgi:hypothetical protein